MIFKKYYNELGEYLLKVNNKNNKKKVLNMFKVNNKNTRTASMTPFWYVIC